ncbi:sulfotransferase family 2 domain-containing protein, partial [Amaricoccus sp.]|uniref:sulfotransferase family 2 domain-containing protein n=1 Tax=Amaricoccus sp. TaxID=1872485 RepID=UPI001B5265AA
MSPPPTLSPTRRLRAFGRFLRRPYYVLRPRLWDEPLPILDDRTMVSRAGRYVYLRVPKAANSTVFRALAERFPEPGLSLDDLADAKTRVTHLGDLGLGELRGLRRYLVFTMVRDPYARTLSAYLDKFREGDKHLDRFGARVATFDGGRASFRGFCRYLADGGEAENAHWIRQSRITGLADRIDILGRVETLDADLARILAAIGAPGGAVARAGP